MKKFISTLFITMLGISLMAQTPDDWTNMNPSNITLTEETSNVNEGASAMHVVSTTQSQSNTEIYSASFSVTPGASYTASINVFDNDTAGRARINIEFDDGTIEWGSYSTTAGTWEKVEKTGSVPSGATTANVFFRFYDNATSWDGDFECILDSASFVEGTGSNLLSNPGFENWGTATPTAYTIPELQDTTGSGSDASIHTGDYIETTGVVTAVYDYQSEFVIQDGTGAFSAIWVSGTGAARGDSVTISGTVAENYNRTIINSDNVSVINSGNTLPAAEVLSTGAVNEEGWEAVLIEATGTCSTDTNSFGEWEINDGSGALIINDYGISTPYAPTVGNSYTVTSPVDYSFSNFKVAVRDSSDIVDNGGSGPVLSITAPSNNATVSSTDVDIEFSLTNFTPGNGTGDGYISYTVDGGTAQSHYSTNPISLTGLSETTHTVKMELLDNSDQPLNPEVKDSVSFTVALPTLTSIYDIQYTTDPSGDSPLLGQDVIVTGIVSANFNGTPHAEGYYIQQGAGAWNGVYVYDTLNSPSIGDSLLLNATVNESYGKTELSNITSYQVTNIGGTVAGPTIITTNEAATMEDYESVLVKVENAECTQAQDQYGEWLVDDGSGEVILKDNGAFSFTESVGNEYNVTGVISYGYGDFSINYRIPSDIQDVSSINDKFSANLNLYPNPAVNSIKLENISEVNTISIFSIDGKLIDKYDVNSNNMTINIADYDNGIYIVKFSSESINSSVRISKVD